MLVLIRLRFLEICLCTGKEGHRANDHISPRIGRSGQISDRSSDENEIGHGSCFSVSHDGFQGLGLRFSRFRILGLYIGFSVSH